VYLSLSGLWTYTTSWDTTEHVSRLSQVNTRLQDVTNQQRRGVYLQVSKKIHAELGELEPYARWTWVDDSDVHWVSSADQIRGTYEPRNNRLRVGLKWHVR